MGPLLKFCHFDLISVRRVWNFVYAFETNHFQKWVTTKSEVTQILSCFFFQFSFCSNCNSSTVSGLLWRSAPIRPKEGVPKLLSKIAVKWNCWTPVSGRMFFDGFWDNTKVTYSKVIFKLVSECLWLSVECV